MRRFWVSALIVLFICSISFAFGLQTGLRKTPPFEFIVKSVRLMRPLEKVETAPVVELDMGDRELLDSTILPMHQREIQASDANGKPVPLIGIAPAGGTQALLMAGDGTLLRMDVEACETTDCLRQVGRLVRPDGTAMNDNYDILPVEIDGKREWYVAYGQQDRTGYTKQLVISRFTPPETAPDNPIIKVEEPFFRSTPFSLRNEHSMRSAGGAMVYDPKTDELVVTVGDYSLNGVGNVFEGPIPPSQDPESHLGKILRIDRQTGDARIITMGHRNPQGLSISKDGELIATEHGPKGGDEINLIEEGKNYGWPYVSMGTLYNEYTFPQKPLREGEPHGGYTTPIFAFMPNPGISAVIHIEGFHPAWDGDLMVATLRGQSLMRARRWPGGGYVEQIYIGDRIRDLDIIGKEMVLVTDSGKIVLLDAIEDLELARSATGLINNMTALESCGACHNVGNAVSTNSAPHLHQIVGRQIASASDYYGYSDGLLSKGQEKWDLESLEAFLRSPQDFAPGTAMPTLDLSDADIAELMELLPLLR